MNRFERAQQIWSLLVWAAAHRQTLTYDVLGRLIGLPQPELGRLLEPVQSLCILEDLPPLTSLVVESRSGQPGEGFIAAADVPQAQAEVFAYGWLDRAAPTADQFAAAVSRLPSCGLSLSALLRQVGPKALA
jgi:hypothetical protein